MLVMLNPNRPQVEARPMYYPYRLVRLEDNRKEAVDFYRDYFEAFEAATLMMLIYEPDLSVRYAVEPLLTPVLCEDCSTRPALQGDVKCQPCLDMFVSGI